MVSRKLGIAKRNTKGTQKEQSFIHYFASFIHLFLRYFEGFRLKIKSIYSQCSLDFVNPSIHKENSTF